MTYSYTDYRKMLSDIDFSGIGKEAIENYRENIDDQKVQIAEARATIYEDIFRAQGIEIHREYHIPEINELESKKDLELFRVAVAKKLYEDNRDAIGNAVALRSSIDFQQGMEPNLSIDADLSISEMHKIDSTGSISREFVDEIKKLDADMEFKFLECEGDEMLAFGSRYNKYSDTISYDDYRKEYETDYRNYITNGWNMFDGLSDDQPTL